MTKEIPRSLENRLREADWEFHLHERRCKKCQDGPEYCELGAAYIKLCESLERESISKMKSGR